MESKKFIKMLNKELKASKAFRSEDDFACIDATLEEIEKSLADWIKKSKSSSTDELAISCDVHESGSSYFYCDYKEDTINLTCVWHGTPDEISFINFFPEKLKTDFQPSNVEIIQDKEKNFKKIYFDYKGIRYNLFPAVKNVSENDNKHEVTFLDYEDILKLNSTCFEEVHKCYIVSKICDLIRGSNDDDEKTWETYQTVLKAIKLWAKKNHIDNESLGYFGDITWMILVAKICLMNREADEMTMIAKFFDYYSKKSTWLHEVRLVDPPIHHDALELEILDKFNIEIWNPEININQKGCFLPVIAPVFPEINTTSKLAKSATKIIQRAFRLGHDTMIKIINDEIELSQLFVPIRLHPKNKYLVILYARSVSPMHKWIDYIEPKLRLLRNKIDEYYEIEMSHIFSKPEPLIVPIKSTLGTIYHEIERRWYIFYGLHEEVECNRIHAEILDMVIKTFDTDALAGTKLADNAVKFAVNYTMKPCDDENSNKIIEQRKNIAFTFKLNKVNQKTLEELKNKEKHLTLSKYKKSIAVPEVSESDENKHSMSKNQENASKKSEASENETNDVIIQKDTVKLDSKKYSETEKNDENEKNKTKVNECKVKDEFIEDDYEIVDKKNLLDDSFELVSITQLERTEQTTGDIVLIKKVKTDKSSRANTSQKTNALVSGVDNNWIFLDDDEFSAQVETLSLNTVQIE